MNSDLATFNDYVPVLRQTSMNASVSIEEDDRGSILAVYTNDGRGNGLLIFRCKLDELRDLLHKQAIAP